MAEDAQTSRTADLGQRLTPVAGRWPALNQVPLRPLRMSTKRRMMIGMLSDALGRCKARGEFRWTSKFSYRTSNDHGAWARPAERPQDRAEQLVRVAEQEWAGATEQRQE